MPTASSGALSGKARRHLRALGHHLRPVVLVGKEGVSPELLSATRTALRDHELIKVKLGEGADGERGDLAEAIVGATGAAQVGLVGRVLLLYKRHPEEPKIELLARSVGRLPAAADRGRRTMYSVVRSAPWLALVLTLGACASPEAATGTMTELGVIDLGGFLQADAAIGLKLPDLSAKDSAMSLADLAESEDLAQSIDLAMSSSDMATSSGCGTVTYAGSCSTDKATVTYCYNNSVQNVTCANGRKCTVVGGDADCRYTNGDPCGGVDNDGLCDGDTLVYCRDDGSNKLTVTDCAASGSSCSTSFGFADCF